jgi:hypothetical protein
MSEHLPTHNADGDPVVPLTEEQRYIFDTKGWLVFPGLIPEDELKPMREFYMRLEKDPESLPEHERTSIAGPLLPTIDHPVVVGFMQEFVTQGYLAGEKCYGFRMESSANYYRPHGSNNFRPHGGSGLLQAPINSHVYHMERGRAYAGLTRIVWELNPVRKGLGGTKFLSGSHKTAFPIPKSAMEDRHSPLWETYECPAGSLVIFTEALSHTGDFWSDEDYDRLAIFRCYNSVGSKWHAWEPHPKLVESMYPLRQTLFRPVHCEHNLVDGDRSYPSKQ